MKFKNYVFQDREANKKNTKGKIIMLLFRLASYISNNSLRKVIFFPYLIFYRLFVEWILGIELPWKTRIGPGLILYHGQATIVNKNTIIGERCILRQSTTIGNARPGGGCPVIGDKVEIGSNVCILGEITIGNNVVIGAGSIITKNIPDNCVVVGNPGRIIKSLI